MDISFRQQVSAYRVRRQRYFTHLKRGTPIYEDYFFSRREKGREILMAAGIVLFFSYFFYRNFLAALLLWPIGIVRYLSRQKAAAKKRRQKLEAEFKDCILSVSANLRAGYSIENAFLESVSDIRSLYGDGGLMLQELERMKKGLSHNIPLETILAEFGPRSGSEEIKEFGEVFRIAKKSGGNLPEVIQQTAELIGEKMILNQEVEVIISGKVFEQKIMNRIPFLLAAYMEFTSRGYFTVLYHNAAGALIMTGCLLLYLASCLLSEKICQNIV